MSYTSETILRAAEDRHLARRAVALASANRFPYPQQWVEANMMTIASAPVDDEGNTVASVYAFAVAQHALKKAELEAAYENVKKELEALKEPGADLDRVRDEQITYAIYDLYNNPEVYNPDAPASA